MAGHPLQIQVLGELQIARGGKSLALPASKKTRALLGYLLVVRGRPQPRQRLCELFWEGPDDPRAALRWSLTKIRPLLDEANVTRLVADRDHVALETQGAAVDLLSVLEAADAGAQAPLEVLREAARFCAGELLEGLDLPECYRYHEWCVAEREAARKARTTVVSNLVERLAAEPAAALAYARMHVAIDPLAECAHIAVMRLLGELGRPAEALRQYESCKRILHAQLGTRPSRELEAMRGAIAHVPASSAPQSRQERASPAMAARASLVGRDAERAMIAAALRDATAGSGGRVLLFSGEPGIGKTRLLEEAADQAATLGATVLSGRAFEAEMVRPYGAWIDALRGLPAGSIEGSLRTELASLLPELGASQSGADRNRLFAAVAKLLGDTSARSVPVAPGAAHGPTVVALDDLQWFDEASVALLHYVARSNERSSRVLLVCAARASELEANQRAMALRRALEREGRLVHVPLSPLDESAVRKLVRAVDDRVDAGRIFAEGGGNPLYSIELARAVREGDGSAATNTLDAILTERLSQLGERASELLPWAAALGHAFSIEPLAALTSLPARELLAGLEQLERHGVLRATAAGAGGSGYDFAHDLVRRAAYRAMSEPRRRWVHQHIARTLDATRDDEGALAADIAHHAALAGDSELAARAYVVAGERCLRLFAYADANRLAGSGLQHVSRLAPERAIRARVALLAIQVRSNQWLKRSRELENELVRVAELAGKHGMSNEAARSFYLLSFVHHESGDLVNARARSLEAAGASQAADLDTRRLQLANTGRCLASLERDLAQASQLLREAESLGPVPTGRTALEVTYGKALLLAFEGEHERALPLLERAAELAEIDGDHWTRSQAMTRMARLALERGRPEEALERCRALEPLVAKLSEGSEGPFARALQALAHLELSNPGASSEAEVALRTLRDMDSKAQAAYMLNALAIHDARGGRTAEAKTRSQEALSLAEAVGQKSEAAVARARLALLALDRGDRADALVCLGGCASDWSGGALSARARAAVSAAADRIGVRL
ncbi:MAG TPA: AAA family ATPase [Polyangiaceae bacterium]|nr:AAA family ATPase [Polyangiaceae bacterium]